MIHIRSPVGAPFAARDHPLAPVAAAFQDEASTGLPVRRKPLTAITSLPRHKHTLLLFEARRRASSTADGHTLPVALRPATKRRATWPERIEKTGKGISRSPAQHHRLQSQSTLLRDIFMRPVKSTLSSSSVIEQPYHAGNGSILFNPNARIIKNKNPTPYRFANMIHAPAKRNRAHFARYCETKNG